MWQNLVLLAKFNPFTLFLICSTVFEPSAFCIWGKCYLAISPGTLSPNPILCFCTKSFTEPQMIIRNSWFNTNLYSSIFISVVKVFVLAVQCGTTINWDIPHSWLQGNLYVLCISIVCRCVWMWRPEDRQGTSQSLFTLIYETMYLLQQRSCQFSKTGMPEF